MLDKFFTGFVIVFGTLLFLIFQFDLLLPNASPTAEVVSSYYAMKSVLQPLFGICVVGLSVCLMVKTCRKSKHK